MSHLDVSAMVNADMNELSPGSLFFYPSGDRYEMATALKPGGSLAYWLNLTGPEAFTTSHVGTGDRYRVLYAGLDSSQLRIRVPSTDKPSPYDSHVPGRLLIERGAGALIATAFRNEASQHYRRRVRISSWELGSLDSGDVAEFVTWSLGFVDDAGGWVSVLDVGSQSCGA